MVLFFILLAISVSLIFVSYQLMRWVWTNIEGFAVTKRGDCVFFLIMSTIGFWFIIPWFGVRVILHKLPFGSKLSEWMNEEVK